MNARHVLTILAVDDLPRATRFYRAALGWEQTVDTPAYVELAGGMRLGLYLRDSFARNTGVPPQSRPVQGTTSTEIYLHVDDVAEAAERLRVAGAVELSPVAARPWGDEAAYFADPAGNVVVVARPL